MLRKTNIKTRTYMCGFEDFMIDIVETDTEYNAYIYREKYGLKSHVYGVMRSDYTLSQFKAMLENSLLEDMHYYDQDMEDIEEA